MYKEIILAALLHDIGKFMQKNPAKIDENKKHPLLSRDFIKSIELKINKYVDTNIVKELVEKHHESQFFPKELRVSSLDKDIRPFGWMVSIADNYSSYERLENADEYKAYKTRPIDSIFSHLSLDGDKGECYQYEAGSFSIENSFPKRLKSYNPVKINNHYNNFLENIGKCLSDASNRDLDFIDFIYQLEGLLEQYLWCIPSNSQEKLADVSLFDHLKTTTAIASCIYLYHKAKDDMTISHIKNKDDKKFRFVVGDVSGIQKYIFSDAKVGGGSVAKRLRAKSFKIQMYSIIVAKRILDEFHLPMTNLLMSSGGKFYLLLPNHSDSQKTINDLKDKINNELVLLYEGMLKMNIVSLEASAKAFDSFGETVFKLNGLLREEKLKPLNSYLSKNNKWNLDSFVIGSLPKENQMLCVGCKKRYADIRSERGYCNICEADFRLGSHIPKLKGFRFCKEKKDISLLGSSILEILDDSENDYIAINDSTEQYNRKFIANYVPSNVEGTKSFSEMAKESEGDKKLAYLKADVDYLGTWFGYGLKAKSEEEKDADSISRISTFSRMMDTFFSAWVNKIIKVSYPNCYIVFSGGDDLFVIGPWTEILLFAKKLYEGLNEFVGMKEKMTMSVGVGFFHHSIPVQLAASSVEEKLERAKNEIAYLHNASRNQVCLQDYLLKWEDYIKVISYFDELSFYVEEGILTKGDLWKLKKYSKQYREYRINKEVNNLSWLSHLAYDISRINKKNEEQDLAKSAIKWLQRLFKIGLKGEENVRLDYLELIVDLTLMKIRETKGVVE